MKFIPEHLGLPAQNPTALADWYVKTLDAELAWADGRTPPAFFVKFSGGLMIEIYQAASANVLTSDNTIAGWRHLAIRVDSIAGAKNILESRGVQFTDTPRPAGGGGTILFFRDAENNLLHLVERPADSVFK